VTSSELSLVEEDKKADDLDSALDPEPETAEMKDGMTFHFDADEENPLNVKVIRDNPEENQNNPEEHQVENQEENKEEILEENQEATKLDFTLQRLPSLTSLPSCSSTENIANFDTSSKFFSVIFHINLS